MSQRQIAEREDATPLDELRQVLEQKRDHAREQYEGVRSEFSPGEKVPRDAGVWSAFYSAQQGAYEEAIRALDHVDSQSDSE